MKLTIYHNPRCSKSRQTMALLEEHGVKPNVVEYLNQPPDQATTLRLARLLGKPVAEILRPNEDDYKAIAAAVDMSDDEAVADRLSQNPKALQRPIVVDEENDRAVIGRPPENVLDLIGS